MASFIRSVARGVKPLAQGAGQAFVKGGRAVVDDVEGGYQNIKESATNIAKSALKGKLKGKGFATKNIKGTLGKHNKFNKFAAKSFTVNQYEGVVVEDPSRTGLFRYDSNAVPYDSFNRNEVSRRMSRPFRFNNDLLPYGRTRQ